MDQKTRDHLTLLAIGYYVLASLTFVASLVLVIYIVGGLALFAVPVHGTGSKVIPRVFGSLVIALGGVGMVTAFTYATLLVVTGLSLARMRHWAFCMAVAVLSCIVFPFGAVLGALTIVMLLRPEVRAAFDLHG